MAKAGGSDTRSASRAPRPRVLRRRVPGSCVQIVRILRHTVQPPLRKRSPKGSGQRIFRTSDVAASCGNQGHQPAVGGAGDPFDRPPGDLDNVVSAELLWFLRKAHPSPRPTSNTSEARSAGRLAVLHGAVEPAPPGHTAASVKPTIAARNREHVVRARGLPGPNLACKLVCRLKAA